MKRDMKIIGVTIKKWNFCASLQRKVKKGILQQTKYQK